MDWSAGPPFMASYTDEPAVWKQSPRYVPIRMPASGLGAAVISTGISKEPAAIPAQQTPSDLIAKGFGQTSQTSMLLGALFPAANGVLGVAFGALWGYLVGRKVGAPGTVALATAAFGIVGMTGAVAWKGK